MSARRATRLAWTVSVGLLIGGLGIVLVRRLDSTPDGSAPALVSFALAAADLSGAVVVEGADYRGIRRSGETVWTLPVGTEPFGYNIRCLQSCPDASIAPYSYYPEQKDAPAMVLVGGEIRRRSLDPQLAKSQTLWADANGWALQWELTSGGTGAVIAMHGEGRTELIGDVSQAPWVTVIAVAPHPVLAVLARRSKGSGEVALVDFAEDSWQIRWAVAADWETVCASGTGDLVLVRTGEVTTMDVDTGAAVSQPFDTGRNFACTGTTSGPIISTYIDTADGSTTTILRGLGFECKGSLDGRYLLSSVAHNVVGFSAGQHRAVVLSGCSRAQVMNDVFGALAVSDDTTVVLDARGQPRWMS